MRAAKVTKPIVRSERAFDLLTRFEPFRQLSPQARALLRQGLVISNSATTAPVLYQGQVVSGCYLVLTGKLRVFTIAPNGAEATLYFIDPGEICVLALNCLFNDLLYPAWVQAETATEIAMIPGAVYRKLFENERAIQNLTVQSLSGLVYRLMAELAHIHASNHRERLAQFMMLHASCDGVLRMTQQQIARHLGTTREVIARLLRDFVNQGMVESQRGALVIRNLSELRRVVAPDAGVPFDTEGGARS
jgi:CRP/FNR family transcriptional regulator, anaerobic regulatory protein